MAWWHREIDLFKNSTSHPSGRGIRNFDNEDRQHQRTLPEKYYYPFIIRCNRYEVIIDAYLLNTRAEDGPSTRSNGDVAGTPAKQRRQQRGSLFAHFACVRDAAGRTRGRTQTAPTTSLAEQQHSIKLYKKSPDPSHLSTYSVRTNALASRAYCTLLQSTRVPRGVLNFKEHN